MNQQQSNSSDNLSTEKTPTDWKIHKINIATSLSWFAEGFKMLGKNPGAWIASVVASFVASLVIIMIITRFMGFFSIFLLPPFFTAGFMFACYQLKYYDTFEIGFIFKGFEEKFIQLGILGLFFSLGGMLAFYLSINLSEFLGYKVYAPDGKLFGTNPQYTENYISDHINTISLFFILLIPIFIGLWFAPAIVIFSEIKALKAIQYSFKAFFKNLIPLIVFFVVFIIGITVIELLIQLIQQADSFLFYIIAVLYNFTFISLCYALLFVSFESNFNLKEYKNIDNKPLNPDSNDDSSMTA
ncbi:MAG: BPSS1780 family membrane protein [Gammaproteobacteria bacterium]|nr:BPSS1780 family membrane protein [Gammaproteobacteria bacterium]MDH5629446.1 BPSS1780 family membrane protein [Gammaproteobacteria bacterium]